MKLEIQNPVLFKTAIEIISELITSANLIVKEDFIEITALDPSLATLTSLKLNKSAFSQYFFTKEEIIPLDLKFLKQILKKVKKERVTIETLDNHQTKVELINENKQSFILPTPFLTEQRTLPLLSFPVSVLVPSKDFKEAIELAKMFSDTVTLSVENNKFTIESKEENGQNISEISSAKIYTEDPSTEYSSKYSVDYLYKMSKAARIFPELKLFFANYFPLKLEFNQDPFFLSFLLAPRTPSS
ncbi:MAG: hypothetical protein QW051_00585 [Candidatus Aenigmatarchaeota archaeon]